MSTGTLPGRDGHAVAEHAERRWAWVVGAIIALLIVVMVATGLHWGAMPPSRVETIDARTLHMRGEFVEPNLGTVVGPDGQVTVRLVAQQYSFTPACLVVPAGVPVTFRGTASDVVHGFIVGRTNANVMLIPGYVATFTVTFPEPGDMLMPCHEYCGTGHEGMWARVRVLEPREFMQRAQAGKAMSCVAG
ncbi:cytochrome C oxidase subunit II [Ramlibacter tataouinensis]|uniref:cytochrome C oxidase subunit II n=1 Tax=Ramlibacter tataouinensis TaxID=94132 RepID=UPI0022F38199|nr:cytochrome C oxidase subunit II [Ramlibacter tataouinensis]WBY02447.1 cytochrome C oxidase subunit II [Ramlibacter tataouinensis]